jgi:hypothetical protein
MSDTESRTPVADALAEVDKAQSWRATRGTGTELAALRNLAEAVRVHLLAHPETAGQPA